MRVEVIGVRHSNAHSSAFAFFDIGQYVFAVGLKRARADGNRVVAAQRLVLHSLPALADADATAVVQGQTFKACWVVEGHAAHLLYEDGDQGLIPLRDFKIPTSA